LEAGIVAEDAPDIVLEFLEVVGDHEREWWSGGVVECGSVGVWE
jgi:hypothetical protein